MFLSGMLIFPKGALSLNFDAATCRLSLIVNEDDLANAGFKSINWQRVIEIRSKDFLIICFIKLFLGILYSKEPYYVLDV
jgi:hypothetical protein